MATLVLTTLLVGATAQDIYFVENSHIIPGNSNFWKFDGKNATKLGVLDKTGTRDFVSSATICGDLYIAAWDIYPSAFGIAAARISTGEHQINPTDYLIHAIACHPTLNNTVFAVGSQPGAKHAQFTLQVVDLAAGNDTVIGTFPTPRQEIFEGWDTIFQFSNDRSEIYAAFGKKNVVFPSNPTSSDLFVMDTASGQVKDSYTVDGQLAGGALYSVFDGLKRAVTVDTQHNPYKLSWADLKCSGTKKCTLHRTGDDTVEWTEGKPFAVCGDSLYAITKDPKSPSANPLYHSSISTGKTQEVIDLSKFIKAENEVGAIAVAC